MMSRYRVTKLLQRKSTYILLLYVILFILLRLPMLGVPLERDEGIYAYVGWIWLTGKGLPFRDVFEMKPPLLHVIYGIPTVLFGNSYIGIRLFSIVWGLAAFGVFCLLLRQFVKGAIFWILALFYIVLANDYSSQAAGFNAEAIQLLPLMMYLYFAVKIARTNKGWFWLGIAAASALWIKQTAYIPLTLIWFYLFIIKKNIPGLLTSLLGGSIVFIGFLGYFLSQGAIKPLFKHMGEYALLSSRHAFSPDYFCNAYVISSHCILNWLLRFNASTIEMALLFALLGYVLAARQRTAVWYIGLLYVLGTFLTIKETGWKDFSHYYLLFNPGLVIGFYFLLRQRLVSGRKIVFKGICISLVLFIFSFNILIGLHSPLTILTFQYGLANAFEFSSAPVVANWLDNHVKQKSNVLILNDEAEIYYYAKRINPTHFGYYYLFQLKPYGPEIRSWIKNEQTNPPEYVVIDPHEDGWGVLELWNTINSKQQYELISQIGVFKVYKNNLAQKTQGFSIDQ